MDLHEQMLAKLEAGWDEFDLREEALRCSSAVKAVVELHKPEPHKYVHAIAWCRRCDCPADQCKEIRAIARALDVPIGDQQ